MVGIGGTAAQGAKRVVCATGDVLVIGIGRRLGK